jgi:phosphoribosylformylglycinamidine cyclo-ligase
MSKSKSAYASAGVDIDEQTAGLKAIKKMVKSTSTPGVLSGIGPFGGMFKSPGKDSILVASTDGVGTKLSVAKACKTYDTVGQDIVNHCVNDILVQGAEPLFFLDYFATSKLSAGVLAGIVKGLAKACRQNGCALLGGETAEMAGVYSKGEFDLVGTIIGSVKRSSVVTGAKIRTGNIIIGLRSSGLHTNGYTLARKVLLEKAGLKVRGKLPGTSTTVGKALLAVHRSYLKPVKALLKKVPIRGMAHITGGGFLDNIPRILPGNVNAVIDCASWKPSPLFSLIQEHGKVQAEEMYRVFNMGIGFIIIVPAAEAEQALDVLRKNGERPVICGKISKGEGVTVLDNLPE